MCNIAIDYLPFFSFKLHMEVFEINLDSKTAALVCMLISVSDPHSFLADPDPARNINADPDPGCQSNADPGPDFSRSKFWGNYKRKFRHFPIFLQCRGRIHAFIF